MTTKMRIVCCVVAVVAPAWVALRAGEQTGPATTGHVLLLENDRILEGDIEQVGDQYRIRRTVGETWVPAGTVVCLCQDLEGAYASLRGRANLRDPDEHLRLARWCQLHCLRPQALDEVTEAVKLRPNDRESQRLLRGLQHSLAVGNPPPASEPADKGEPISPSAMSLDLTAESIGLFSSRVQPILMNTCANCHATGRGGAFKLSRAYEESLTNRRATQQNLAAVLAQVNREHPLASPLLTRAVSVHGEADQPPLKSRQTSAYRILEEWVRLTVADSQPEERATPPATLPVVESKGTPEAMPSKPDPLALSSPPVPGSARSVGFPGAQAAAMAAPTSTQPADPFDPGIFNRQMHPAQEK